MFDLPASKRVRRADLHDRTRFSSPSSTRSSPDPELEIQAQARFAALFGDFSLPDPGASVSGKAGLTSKQGRTYQEDDRESNNEGEEEQGFEFRLFSSAPNKPAGKIVLKPEEDEDGDGNFVRRERDKSYYFAPPASGERKAGIESMAISGETVLLWRKIRAKGLEVPWRVKTIRVPSSNPTPTGSSLKSEAIVVDEGETRKKCKPNKKRRLILREKQRKKEKAEEEKRKRDQGREEAEREKKTRKNREKKVKRKLKEKLKKASGTVESRTVGNGNDRDDDDDADVDMENGEE